MKAQPKQLPQFFSPDEEFDFWQKADIDEYASPDAWQRGQEKFQSHISPPQPITIRMSGSMLGRLKRVAKQIDVPYQALIKIAVNEYLNEQMAMGRVQ